MDISANPANQVAEAEMADIDQFRPAKKSRAEPGSLQATEDVREEMADEDEDWDDIYGTDAPDAQRQSKPSAVEQQIGSAAVLPMTTEHTASGIATNNDQDVDMTASEGAGTLPLAAPGQHQDAEAKPAQPTGDDVTARMADAGIDNELVDESKSQIPGVDEPSSRIIQETSELEQKAAVSVKSEPAQDHEVPAIQTHADTESNKIKTEDSADAEFAAAAKAQKGKPEAEFEWDSSSEESSSDSSSSDDDDSDEDIEPMDAETLGKILMAEDGGDGDGKIDPSYQPRTQNEVEIIFPKPDLTVTPDMKITSLGRIEHFVGNVAVVLGNTSAHDEVMEIESVLCNDERQVIGVIQDAMCKVDEPRYIVAFASPEEFEALGLKVGSNVNYVNDHSKSVFTKGLRGKGTDASNIHDEEVGEDEMDFSDDEMEAEFKRKNKESKKAGRGALSRGAFNRGEHKQFEQDSPNRDGAARGGRGGRGGRGRGRGGADGPMYSRGAPGASGTPYDKPQKDFPSVLNYDDDAKADPDDDGMYTPLKRPDNMAQMQQMGGAPQPQQRSNANGARGRGGNDRGRGRGRGDRGRGDRQGQSRGDFHNSPNQQQQQAQQPQAAQFTGSAPQTQAPPVFQQPMAQGQGLPQAQAPYQFNFGQMQQPQAQPQAQQQYQPYPQPYQQPYQQPFQQPYQQPNAYPQYPQMQQQAFSQAPQAQAQPQAQAAPATAEQWAQYCQQNPAAIAQMMQHLASQQQGRPQ